MATKLHKPSGLRTAAEFWAAPYGISLSPLSLAAPCRYINKISQETLHKNKKVQTREVSSHSPSFFTSLIHALIQCGIDGIRLLVVFLIRATGEQTACVAVKLEHTEEEIQDNSAYDVLVSYNKI